MRMLFTLVALAGLIAPAAAEDPKPKDEPEKKPEAALKVGDPAPPVQATKWLQGAEVKEFAKGKVYVMEFWATWCGPCIVMMPHMGELQREYKDKGVTFIGFTRKDDRGNTLEKVQALVEKRGPKLGYTFAYADNAETYDAWMKAAKQGGIPCCFVVDRAGKIAYIGHPMFLDVVLPKVVAGTWTAADTEGLKKIEEDVDAVFAATGDKDPNVFLTKMAEFDKEYPGLSSIPYFQRPRLTALIKAKKTDEAKAKAEALIAKGVKTEDPGILQTVSSALRGPEAKDNKELLALSVKAAEAAVKLAGEKDAVALYYLAEAYFATGDKAKAKDTGAKAVAAADAGLKKQLERLVEKYDDEKKKDDEKKDK